MVEFYMEDIESYSTEEKVFLIKESDCDIQLNFTLKPKQMLRVWGYVRENLPRMVTLLMPSYIRGEVMMAPAQTVPTDEGGYFQFIVENADRNPMIRVSG